MKTRYLQILFALFLIIFMVINPKEVYSAALQGLNAWWKMVLPALLPFFIGSELLMGFGVVRFMGVLLEPVMRPLFNLPGCGSFVMAIGYTSGFPISSVITAKLRKDQLISQEEGERLMSFTNNSSPLFMLGAIAIGMFNNPSIGIIILIAHYFANIIIGLFLSFKNRGSSSTYMPPPTATSGILRRAFRELKTAYRENPMPLGHFIGEAIKKSVQTLLLIGGFVIFFSVMLKILSLLGFIDLIAYLFSFIFFPLGFELPLLKALTIGLFEITLGAKAASEVDAPLIQQIVITSIILGWSGLNVHAQVATMISGTDLKMGLFFLSRLAHGVLAGIFSWLLMLFFEPKLTKATTVFSNYGTREESYTWFELFSISSLTFLVVALALLSLAVVVYITRQFRLIRFKY